VKIALLALLLSATGQKVGSPVEFDVSARKVTATGSTTARALKDRAADVVNVKDYLPAGQPDGTTDNTAGLQAWINEAASRGAVAELHAPAFGKAYRFTKLTIPQGAGKSFTIRGAGAADDVSSVDPALYQRSILVSTDPTGPAIEIAGGASYTARQIAIEGITVLASNSTAVVTLTGANTGTRLKDVFLRQSGTGHGIDWLDVWFGSLEDVFVQADRATTAVGSVGIRVRNTLDGGIFNATRVTTLRKYNGAGGFDIGMQFGALVGETQAANIDAVACVSCTAQHSSRGVVFGKGVKGATLLGLHTEFNETSAVHVTNTASAVTVQGGFFYNPTATAADVVIDGDATSNSQHAINLIGNRFEAVHQYGIDLVGAAYTSGNIIGNWFSRYGAAGAGIGIRTRSSTTPWSVIGNTFSGMVAGVDDATVLALQVDTLGNVSARGAFYSPNGQLTVKGATIGADGLSVAGVVSLLSNGTGNFQGGVSPGSPAGGAFQAGKVYQGSGVPSNANGNDGDTYLRTDTPGTANQRIYVKSAGAWVGIL
jgi:hypothetical protein